MRRIALGLQFLATIALISSSVAAPLDEESQAHEPKAVAPQDAELITRSYSVADLVVFPLDLEHVDDRDKRILTADFDQLIGVIRGSVQPDSWDVAMGPGTVTVLQKQLRLVIRHTQAVHEEICDLLGQLRRSGDFCVQLNMRLLKVPEMEIPDTLKLLEQSGPILKGAFAKHILAKHRLDERQPEPTIIAIPLPNLVLGDGETRNLAREGRLPDGSGSTSFGFKIRAEILKNRKTIRLKLAAAVTDRDLVLESSIPASVGVHETIVCDVTRLLEIYRQAERGSRPGPLDKPAARELIASLKRVGTPGARELLVITPQIMVVEEEEELLGVDLPKQGAQ